MSKKDKKQTKVTTPVFVPDDSIKTALVVTAHPDDVDYGAAGTVAVLTAAGVSVSYCLVTSGDAGGDEDTRPRDERSADREREQTAAAEQVGVRDLHFLRIPDGTVEPTLALRQAITRVIRVTKPDLVICQNPERNWDRIGASHPDHLAAGEATVRALYPDAGNPHAHPQLLDEGHLPHKVAELWLMSTASPNVIVDITDTLSAKLAALRCHASQIADFAQTEEWVRSWTTGVAKANGLGKKKAAEGFRRVKLR